MLGSVVELSDCSEQICGAAGYFGHLEIFGNVELESVYVSGRSG